MDSLAAAGIILIAPWSNGIDLLGVVFALSRCFVAAYIVLGGKVSKIMKGGEAVAGMLFAALLILPFEF
jgi:inner membrane transporter RhtA